MVYLRFWYLLPKFIVSLTLACSLLVIFLGSNAYQNAVYFFDMIQISGNEFWDGFIVVFALLSISWLAMVFQDAILSLFRQVIRTISKWLKIQKKIPAFTLSSFELGRHIFKNNKKKVMEFVRIRTYSMPEIFEDYSEISKSVSDYYNKVEKYYDSLQDIEMLEIFTYESSLTQEQAHSDKYRNNVEILEFSLFLFPLILINLYLLNIFTNITLMIFAYLIWLILTLYFYRKLKYRYAYYLMWSFLESFNIGPPAEVADRPI